jgi:hypothetical protein
MDADALGQWILRRLGAPFLKVELTQDHLDDCVEDARRWFVAKKGVTKFYQTNVLDGVTEYILPSDVDTVTDLMFAGSSLDLSLVFSPFILIDDKVPYDVFAAPSSMGLYSSFTQTLMYIDMAKKVLSADEDWRHEGRKLYITPRPKNATYMIVEYKANMVTIEHLGERDHDLIKRFALAKAKEIVGRVRSKYDSFPTAQGSAGLDGPTLLDEARTELELLEEEIALSGFPMMPVVG